MLCKPCYYTNRIRRDGGEFALCWQHKKTKCRLCKEISAGKLYCAKCEHEVDILRWKRESGPTFYDDDHEFLQVQLRKQKLLESKYHLHRAVEVAYRALSLAVEAIWGGIKQPNEKTQEEKKHKLEVV